MNYSYKKRNSLKDASINTKLIFANLICFFIFTSLILYYGETSIEYIAIKPLNILSGNFIWTFLTSMFMHAGFLHLFVNMFSLFFVGSLTEKILGSKRYLWFYLISGLFAGLFFVLSSCVFSSGLDSYAVGASGALFGVVGLLMFLTPNLRVYIMFIPIPIKLKYAAPGILALLWLISIAGNIPIGNTAHLGGFLCGVVYGLYLRKKYPRKVQRIGGYFR